jgi:hypothetical protein
MPRHRREPGNPDIRTCNPTLTTKLIIYVVHCFEDVHRLQYSLGVSPPILLGLGDLVPSVRVDDSLGYIPVATLARLE